MALGFEENVKKGFASCKSDIDFLKAENKTLKEEILELKFELKGLKTAIDVIKDFTANKTEASPLSSDNVSNQPLEIKETKSKKDPYEALLEFKAKSNKRELLKQKIISMVGENGMNLSELKFMFVEHFKYCSKATFYNYLKELELERMVKIERENSKNFVFPYAIRREI